MDWNKHYPSQFFAPHPFGQPEKLPVLGAKNYGNGALRVALPADCSNEGHRCSPEVPYLSGLPCEWNQGHAHGIPERLHARNVLKVRRWKRNAFHVN